MRIRKLAKWIKVEDMGKVWGRWGLGNKNEHGCRHQHAHRHTGEHEHTRAHDLRSPEADFAFTTLFLAHPAGMQFSNESWGEVCTLWSWTKCGF